MIFNLVAHSIRLELNQILGLMLSDAYHESVDRGSQIPKTYNNAKINFNDMKYKIHYNVDVEFELCPVDGHNYKYNGKVERRIREIKQSLTKSYNDQKLSVLQWETVASEIANCLNDLPILLGNYVSDFESMDLITPNKLKLGRNNERSPVGPYELSNDPSKIVKANSLIYQSWFDSWLINTTSPIRISVSDLNHFG